MSFQWEANTHIIYSYIAQHPITCFDWIPSEASWSDRSNSPQTERIIKEAMWLKYMQIMNPKCRTIRLIDRVLLQYFKVNTIHNIQYPLHLQLILLQSFYHVGNNMNSIQVTAAARSTELIKWNYMFISISMIFVLFRYIILN